MKYKNIFFLIIAFSLFFTGCSYKTSQKIEKRESQISQNSINLQETPKNSLFDELSLQSYSTKKDKISKRLFEVYYQWRGTRYRLGGTTKKGIDCSAFVQKMLQQGFDLSMPRNTILLSNLGVPVEKSELRTGDLVFFRTKRTHHVGIYIEGGRFMHASTKVGVTISKLDNIYYKSVYWKAQRIFN